MKELTKSFKCAARGFLFCIKNERNMRIHTVMAVYVLVFSLFYQLSALQYALLFIVIASVMSCEMINTSIERIVDLVSPGYNKLAGIAKDIAAGAVFVTAIMAVIIGVILFWDIPTFKNIITFLIKNPFIFIILLLSLVISIIFILKCPKNKNTNKKQIHK